MLLWVSYPSFIVCLFYKNYFFFADLLTFWIIQILKLFVGLEQWGVVKFIFMGFSSNC